MEASDVVKQEPGDGESADGSPVAVGSTAFDGYDDHQPLGAEDQHGTVTPRSAPPAGPQPGIDPKTGQPGIPPAGEDGESQE